MLRLASWFSWSDRINVVGALTPTLGLPARVRFPSQAFVIKGAGAAEAPSGVNGLDFNTRVNGDGPRHGVVGGIHQQDAFIRRRDAVHPSLHYGRINQTPGCNGLLESHAACPIGATEEPERSHGDWIDVEVCQGERIRPAARCSGIAGSVCVVSNIQ